jgi:glycosyltransferase involved in cell wall biosynthesis
MRILFLHEVNYLEKPIFEMHEFPEYLALRGHQVGFVHFPEGWNKEQIRAQGFKSKNSGRAARDADLTLYTPESASGSMLGRFKTALTFGATFRKVLSDFQPDVVVSFSVPTSGWQALGECRKQNIPYIFRALDVSHKIRKNFYSLLVKRAEKYIYQNSSSVSANNPAMAEYCISMGARRERTSVDLPPIDLSHFSNARAAREELRERLGISSNKKVIAYMGSFFYFSGLPEVVTEFSKSKDESLVLLLIGGGEQAKELEGLVSRLGISDRVIFTGFVSFQDLPNYLGVADVAINAMHRTLVSNAAFPNKVLQYMASGLPVVSTDLEGLRMTFGETAGLRLVSAPEKVFESAQTLLSEPDLQEIGRQNKEVGARIFSRDGAVLAFETLLKKTVGSND